MKLIAAVDEHWGIGKNGDLLLRISQDMKRFRMLTTGNVIVMGRKTLESFPNKKPLPNRINIVLSHNTSYQPENCIVINNLPALFQALAHYHNKDIFVIGGGRIYNLLLPYCTEALITKIQHVFPADTYLENLDVNSQWELIASEGESTEKDIAFQYLIYKNTQVSSINGNQ